MIYVNVCCMCFVSVCTYACELEEEVKERCEEGMIFKAKEISRHYRVKIT